MQYKITVITADSLKRFDQAKHQNIKTGPCSYIMCTIVCKLNHSPLESRYNPFDELFTEFITVTFARYMGS